MNLLYTEIFWALGAYFTSIGIILMNLGYCGVRNPIDFHILLGHTRFRTEGKMIQAGKRWVSTYGCFGGSDWQGGKSSRDTSYFPIFNRRGRLLGLICAVGFHERDPLGFGILFYTAQPCDARDIGRHCFKLPVIDLSCVVLIFYGCDFVDFANSST